MRPLPNRDHARGSDCVTAWLSPMDESGQPPGKALGPSVQVAQGSVEEVRTFCEKNTKGHSKMRSHTLSFGSERFLIAVESYAENQTP